MKVGDYVRDHTNGIGRVIKCYNNELEIVFNKATIKTTVSSYFEFNLNKSSPNIIDLIEIGDYVNGYLIEDKTIFGNLGLTHWMLKTTTGYLNERNIYTIVTKEQFESMKYEVNK